MKSYCRKTLLLLWIAAAGRLIASVPGLAHSPSRYQTGFSQEFNSYIWTAGVAIQEPLSPRWRIDLQEMFRSSMLRLSTEDKWKDDQSLSLQLSFFLQPRWTLFTSLQSQVFTDKQSGLQTDLQTHTGQIGLRMIPRHGLRLQAAVGPKWDQRFEQFDQGLSYQVDADVRNLEWGDYSHRADLKWGGDEFPVRRNKDLNFQYRLTKDFAAGARDSLHLVTQNRRVDNYTSALGDVESYRDRVMGFENILLYPVSTALHLSVQSKILSRDVQVISTSTGAENRERKRNDQIFDNSLRLRWNYSHLTGYCHLAYWSQSQRYDLALPQENSPFSRRTALITPDNTSNRLYLSGLAAINMSRADSLSAYFTISRFRYDTPDSNNFDDRDELRLNGRLIFSHIFSPQLRAEVQAGVNLYHMVYIFGERSADNTWNRIFRLQPRLFYERADLFVFKQSAEVLANYIDYDFEIAEGATRSFVFRQFALDDSLQIRLFQRSKLHLSYRLQLEDNGQLYWDRWSERLLLTRRSHWLRCLWSTDLSDHISLIPGFVFYLRDEWRHQNDAFGVERKTQSASFRSRGPILRLYIRLPNRLRCSFEGLRQVVDMPEKRRYAVNQIDMQLSYFF
ncbi:MAG TPA: hypothetical protein PKN04_12870 [bacterium]|nr:hypothetical protein [bacterium]HNT66667.1 hypothetical protein [bacterium]HOX87221.1 hypothetical protein [bacterium]HPG46682.1 hypothetical protein [bacterium]HPM98786.1 hypothetical protein [bacterium]